MLKDHEEESPVERDVPLSPVSQRLTRARELLLNEPQQPQPTRLNTRSDWSQFGQWWDAR